MRSSGGKGTSLSIFCNFTEDRKRSKYDSFLQVFTDGSKEIIGGKTGFLFVIPQIG